MGIRVDNANDAALATTNASLFAEAVGRATADTAIHAVYKPLVFRNTVVNDGQSATTLRVAPTSGAVVQGAAGTLGAVNTFAINTSELAVSGLTTKLNLQVTCMTNATSVGTTTFTTGLYPVSAVAGGTDSASITIGTITSGSSVTFANPSTSTITTSTSGDFDIPTTGLYVLAETHTVQPAADSFVSLVYTLRYRHV